MGSENPHVGIWMQPDTITSNKVQNQILNELKKVSSFPGIISEFKIFVGKLMGIEPNHPAIVPVYDLIIGKTVNYFPSKNNYQKAKKKSRKRLTKIEKSLKSALEGIGICLKIPLSISTSNASDGQPGCVPPDKEWCDNERKRILKAVKKRLGVNDREFATGFSAKRKTRKSDVKKRKCIKKTDKAKSDRLRTNIEVIDIAEIEEDRTVCTIEPEVSATSDFEVIDITEQDDDLVVLKVCEKSSNDALMELRLGLNS